MDFRNFLPLPTTNWAEDIPDMDVITTQCIRTFMNTLSREIIRLQVRRVGSGFITIDCGMEIGFYEEDGQYIIFSYELI